MTIFDDHFLFYLCQTRTSTQTPIPSKKKKTMSINNAKTQSDTKQRKKLESKYITVKPNSASHHNKLTDRQTGGVYGTATSHGTMAISSVCYHPQNVYQPHLSLPLKRPSPRPPNTLHISVALPSSLTHIHSHSLSLPHSLFLCLFLFLYSFCVIH